MIAFAQEHKEVAQGFVDQIERLILFPLISVLLGVALLFFLWGAFRFVAHADDEGERTIGKRHMLFGLIGMVIMLSALSILRIAAGTFGVGTDLP